MLFNTIQFVYFLPLVVILYYLIPHKLRWLLLLIASYYFYMCWKVEYIFLILASTLIDYFCGIQMDKFTERNKKLPYLILSLVTNLGLLFAFKYFNFFFDGINMLFDQVNISSQIPVIDILLPVGISFYTFQTLSYSIDVYYGKQKAEKHLGYFALYVSFFPQLVAGPIERFSRLTPQLKERHQFSYENLINGLRLIVYGLFVKMVIADNLSPIVDQIYAAPENFNSLAILISLCFYSFQIYCDFFGYSSIAIGSALIMGINLMDNFKTPYLSISIAEFWQRWHISLSTWFRDYLYYPMGGNKVSKTRWIYNILIVFFISGFWHGANWTFIFWGGLFGVIYLIENGLTNRLGVNKSYLSKLPVRFVLTLKTFILVTIIWVFFRSPSFTEAINIFSSVLKNSNVSSGNLIIPSITWILLALFICSDILLYNKRFDSWIDNFSFPIRWGIYCTLIFSIIVFSGVDNFPFIYFQF